MKLTPSESKLVDLIDAAGGSICPGTNARIMPEVHRLCRKLERRGVLEVEQTDDGERFTLTGAHNG